MDWKRLQEARLTHFESRRRVGLSSGDEEAVETAVNLTPELGRYSADLDLIEEEEQRDMLNTVEDLDDSERWIAKNDRYIKNMPKQIATGLGQLSQQSERRGSRVGLPQQLSLRRVTQSGPQSPSQRGTREDSSTVGPSQRSALQRYARGAEDLLHDNASVDFSKLIRGDTQYVEADERASEEAGGKTDEEERSSHEESDEVGEESLPKAKRTRQGKAKAYIAPLPIMIQSKTIASSWVGLNQLPNDTAQAFIDHHVNALMADDRYGSLNINKAGQCVACIVLKKTAKCSWVDGANRDSTKACQGCANTTRPCGKLFENPTAGNSLTIGFVPLASPDEESATWEGKAFWMNATAKNPKKRKARKSKTALQGTGKTKW